MAGGSGTRLYPITLGISKHLIPIYDKPMIFYPISVLMLAGIRDILIISSPDALPAYRRLLGCGERFGINLEYAEQAKPTGLADAFIIGESFIQNDSVCLILGDNIFYGHNFTSILRKAMSLKKGATIFGYKVNDPYRYGVVEFDESFRVKSIEEKPKDPKSNFAITGVYFYDNSVIEIAKQIKPSDRGETEISDINKQYLNDDLLSVELLGRGFTWLDTGTHDSLNEASNFVKTIEQHQGFKIACLEEIAYSKMWLDDDGMQRAIKKHEKTAYGHYLLNYFERCRHAPK